MTQIVLPWPARRLHPNARVHFHERGRVTKAARHDAWIAALAAIGPAERATFREAGAVEVTITFCPPDKRRRDDDGMIASFKAARDGIADALGVDDARWRVSYAIGEPVKGGRVVVDVQVPAEVA